MGKKIYFSVILFFTIFSYYYQFVIYSDFTPLPVLMFLRDTILVVGGFSLYFNRPILEAQKWGYLFKFLLVLTISAFVYQILPTSFYGDFSIFNASFLTNVFVYLLLLCFYLPLFFAVNQLSKPTKTSKKRTNNIH